MMSIGSLQTSTSGRFSLVYLFSVLLFWTSVNCWSYDYSNFTMNWNEARAWCQKHHTDMVAIQNQEEIAHLNSWLPRKATYYWIGIRKINDVWTWVGTNKSLTEEAKNWAQGEPNNLNKNSKGGEDCVEMYIKREKQAGKWNDERCGKYKTALCYSVFYCNRDEITVPENGGVNCTHKYGDFAYDSECQYSCEEGYQLSAPTPLKCTADKTWSDQPPTCELMQCPKLSSPQWGSMKCSNPLGSFSYQSTCVFTCEEGFVLRGSHSDTLFCGPTGQWDASQPSCTAVQCPAIPEMENAVVNCHGDAKTKYAFGNSCSFTCLPGYDLVGTTALTCTSSAEWSANIPFCQYCPRHEAKPNLLITCSSNQSELAPGSTCSFSCEPGFQLQGAENLQCSDDAQWDEVMPMCKVMQCPKLSSPQWGSLKCFNPLGSFSYQSTCVFTCEEGFVLSGSHTLSCGPTGQWNVSQPSCTAVQCPTLPEQSNLLITCEDLSFGSSCSFSCATGFSLVGPKTTTCTSSAVWSDSMPLCEAVACPLLEAPQNGHMNCSLKEFIYNSECAISCDQDYTLYGHATLTCGHYGNWTGEMPTCNGVTAGGAVTLSGLSLAMWILKKLKNRASKFDLSSSDIDVPPQHYKSSIDSLI
ncbi:hypothetical protein WMY93_024494 [Mugilogobius chulae]|uniref:Selectin P n=1 Tax=Mugilogobius chulae TaxID=88201 RepID=A0AAW0N5C9_9GOBI